LLFDKLIDQLPTIKRLYEKGMHGDLLTCDPPITVPAWAVMMTGQNPGKLGIYGFRHRRGFAYNDGYLVNATHVKPPTVWDILAKNGKSSIVLGVPPGYPPKPISGGNLVSCFITPSIEKEFTYPASLKKEIMEITDGKYLFDVTFRTEDRDAIKKELFEMTETRFDVAEYLVKKKRWDFFIMHEIGFDRLHHAFWKFFDPAHPKYEKGNRYETIDSDYYKLVDKRIGRVLDAFGKDTVSFVLSDHGSKAMKGAFCVNEWLENQGYLKLNARPPSQIDLDKADVDWASTKAWGWGGYYARIFFNVKGREKNGVIPPEDLPREKSDLTQKINSITDPSGRKMSNKILEPDKLYGSADGDKPDLMVYFDDLNWRSAGTIGHGSLYLSENDTGPDDSVHSMEGVFLVYNPKRSAGGKELKGLRIEDIGPTILKIYGLQYEDARLIDGRVIPEVVKACQ
jgi:predicted AlkP superfamily phosphohydrolase/phosphomutase